MAKSTSIFGRIHGWDLWPQQSHNPEGGVLSDLAWTPVCKATKSVAMRHEMLSVQKALFTFLGVFPTLTYVSVISRLSTKLSTTAGITAHQWSTSLRSYPRGGRGPSRARVGGCLTSRSSPGGGCGAG